MCVGPEFNCVDLEFEQVIFDDGGGGPEEKGGADTATKVLGVSRKGSLGDLAGGKHVLTKAHDVF